MPNENSLRQRILDFLFEYRCIAPEMWIHRAILEQKTKEAGFLADNCTRRLRELVEEEKITHRRSGKSQEYQWGL